MMAAVDGRAVEVLEAALLSPDPPGRTLAHLRCSVRSENCEGGQKPHHWDHAPNFEARFQRGQQQRAPLHHHHIMTPPLSTPRRSSRLAGLAPPESPMAITPCPFARRTGRPAIDMEQLKTPAAVEDEEDLADTLSPAMMTSPAMVTIFGETGVLEDVRGHEPEEVTIFGVTGVLQAEPGPPPPDAYWPTDWPEEWEEEEWWDGTWCDGDQWEDSGEWEWEDGEWDAGAWDDGAWEEELLIGCPVQGERRIPYGHGGPTYSPDGPISKPVFGEEEEEASTAAPATPAAMPTHIRFTDEESPVQGERLMPYGHGGPTYSPAAIAIAVATSGGGKAVKKSKSKQCVDVPEEVVEESALENVADLEPRLRARVGAHARAARSAFRAETALAESGIRGATEEELAAAGPLPVLSAGMQVLQRKAREKHEAEAAEKDYEGRVQGERRIPYGHGGPTFSPGDALVAEEVVEEPEVVEVVVEEPAPTAGRQLRSTPARKARMKAAEEEPQKEMMVAATPQRMQALTESNPALERLLRSANAKPAWKKPEPAAKAPTRKAGSKAKTVEPPKVVCVAAQDGEELAVDISEAPVSASA